MRNCKVGCEGRHRLTFTISHLAVILLHFRVRPHERKTESRISIPDDERGARLSLLVMGSGGVFTYPLPERGEVTIGRSVRCEICIDDARLSREHARLVVGAHVEIVDLGSSNGTRVGEEKLEANAPRVLSVGDLVAAGGARLILQPASAAPRLRHLWTHGYFEARLEDECARADETGRPFAVARLRAAAGPKAIEDWLAEHLRTMDVVAAYAPDEYEIFLPEVDAKSAAGVVARLRAELASLGGRTQVGFACWPGDGRTPEELISRAAPSRGAEERAPGVTRKGREPIAGGAIDRLRPIVERVSAGSIPVLVVGETGVGKDVLASSIHTLSPRAKKPFMCVNCAALPDALLESELFGFERGAFTGAVASKPGLLEIAEGGTVFLDEVGEMPLALQAKLLRVLDQREVMRVGGLAPRAIDVRFVAATNRDLEAQVQAGSFREDLYYRLNAVVIVVPPLRERVAEIAPLARQFAIEASRGLGRVRGPAFEPAAMELLEKYTWPGNVRELRNVVERAVLLCEGHDTVTVAHLPHEKMGRVLPVRDSQRMRVRPPPVPATPPSGAETIPPAMVRGDDDGRAKVVAALERCRGNQTHAAKMLGVSRRTLITKMERYGLPRPRKDRGSSPEVVRVGEETETDVGAAID
jgi:DNA-binding NtrC family response regulator